MTTFCVISDAESPPMKLTFSALFQAPLKKYTRFFIYGNDPAVFERAGTFIQQTLSLKRQIKTEAELLKSPHRSQGLFEETTQASLTLVPHVTDALLKQIETLPDDVFIFISDKARAQSKLVTYFGQHPQSLAIAAYATPLLMAEVEALTNGIPLSPPFKKELFTTYKNDYAGLLNAVETIKLLGEDAEAYGPMILASTALPESTTNLLDGLFLRDPQKLTAAFSSLSPTDAIPLLRQLTRSFLTLLELMPYRSSPEGIKWQSLSTPVFFKEQPRFEAALTRWNGKEILAFLNKLLTLERAIKFDNLSMAQFSESLLKGAAR